MYQHFLNNELRLLWGETAAWPSIFTPLPDAPVMWVGKTTEMAGNFAVVFPSEGLLPSDPPLPVAIGPIDGMNPAFSLALCPEKFFALRDGLRDMPESMAMTSRFWIAHYSTIMSMCVSFHCFSCLLSGFHVAQMLSSTHNLSVARCSVEVLPLARLGFRKLMPKHIRQIDVIAANGQNFIQFCQCV